MITKEELESFRSDVISRMKVFKNTPVTSENVSDRLATGVGLVVDVFGGIYNELMYMNDRQEPLYTVWEGQSNYKDSKAGFKPSVIEECIETKVGGTD